MNIGALLWLKVGDTIGNGLDENTLIYREMKNGHFYGLFWNDFLDMGSIVRLDDAKYCTTVFSKEDGVNFIKQHDEHDFECYI